MKVTWGSFTVEDNGTWFTISRSQIMGQTGRRIGYSEKWNVGGVLKADDVDALTTKITALENALAQDGQDLLFYDNSDNLTSHTLYSANTLNGTRVTQRPSFPKGNPGIWGSGVEYVGQRSFQFTVEAEILDPDGVIATYHETVQQLSALVPRFRMVESFTGQAQRQQLVQFPKTVVVQSGMAVGINGYPTAATILFPNWLMSEPYSLTASEPMKLGVNQNILFPISWRYQFEAPYGQIGAVPPPPSTL